MDSLATELPAQINRVRELQDQYKSLRGMRNVIVEPQIAIMEHSIRRAIEAQSSGDVVEILRAYEDLKGFK